MREVQAIIFDLDDTLWEVGPVIVRAEHAMLAFLADRYPRVLERHTLDSMRDVRARMAIEHPAMRHDFTWLRLESLRHHARDADYPEALAEEAFAVFYRVRNEVVLYDDARPALERLHGRYRLFAVSNGNADLAAIGLACYFVGKTRANGILHWYGIILLLGVAARLFIIDVWHMELSGRIVTFFLVGILFISTAFFSRVKKSLNPAPLK
jgi:putative hydrolase of the HAD superfamily